MIEARGLSKRYGETVAVDNLSFTVRPGLVTGFLGPNGAGKSTTMRLMMGLDRATSGTVEVNGRAYADHAAPLREVGALLEARAIHPGRSARNHLRALALTAGLGRARVEEVLGMVGLSDVADQRVAGFSLGMGQRLGVAAALLGDPHTLILDEPVNGLDLNGIRWIRALLRRLADEGRTVFLSSHLMSEMAVTADRVIVVGRGRLLRDQEMDAFIREASVETLRVVTPDAQRLSHLLRRAGAVVRPSSEAAPPPGRSSLEPAGDTLEVEGVSGREVGSLAAGGGITLWELSPHAGSLEDAYLALTGAAVAYADTSRPGDRADDRADVLTEAGPEAGPEPSTRRAGSAVGR